MMHDEDDVGVLDEDQEDEAMAAEYGQQTDEEEDGIDGDLDGQDEDDEDDELMHGQKQ